MQLNLIACIDENYGLSWQNNLLYQLPFDLAHFKQLTLNKVVIMGYNTFMSLPLQQPLKNRINIVLSKNHQLSNCLCFTSLNQLFNYLNDNNFPEVFVIGGATIYQQLLPYCTKAYLTIVQGQKTADTFFPKIFDLANWKLREKSLTYTYNQTKYCFTIYQNEQVKKYVN